MKHCVRCGADLVVEDAMFCPECGAAVPRRGERTAHVADDATPTRSSSPPVRKRPETDGVEGIPPAHPAGARQRPRKSHRSWWTGLIVAAVIIAIAAVLVFVVFKDQIFAPGYNPYQDRELQAGWYVAAIESYYAQNGTYPQSLYTAIPEYGVGPEYLIYSCTPDGQSYNLSIDTGSQIVTFAVGGPNVVINPSAEPPVTTIPYQPPSGDPGLVGTWVSSLDGRSIRFSDHEFWDEDSFRMTYSVDNGGYILIDAPTGQMRFPYSIDGNTLTIADDVYERQ